jgi:hypothetical protein
VNGSRGEEGGRREEGGGGGRWRGAGGRGEGGGGGGRRRKREGTGKDTGRWVRGRRRRREEQAGSAERAAHCRQRPLVSEPPHTLTHLLPAEALSVLLVLDGQAAAVDERMTGCEDERMEEDRV